MKLRGVLFDVGYALMDETPRLHVALDWIAKELAGEGLGLSPEQLLAGYRKACLVPHNEIPSLIVQQLIDLGAQQETAERLRRELNWDTVPLEAYPDAVDALRALHRADLRVGVLANQPESALDDLERAGLAELCDGVWLSDAVGLHKPDPAFFKVALESWGLDPATVAYVGDRPDRDVKPAKALGLYTVRVLQGPHAGQAPKDDSETAHVDVATLTDAAAHLIGLA